MRTAAPQYIRERRLADPGWVRRYRRSLGANKQFRARVRMDHEAREALAKKAKLAEVQQAVKASAAANKPTLWERAKRLFPGSRSKRSA